MCDMYLGYFIYLYAAPVYKMHFCYKILKLEYSTLLSLYSSFLVLYVVTSCLAHLLSNFRLSKPYKRKLSEDTKLLSICVNSILLTSF